MTSAVAQPIAQALSGLARTLASDRSVDATLDAIVASAAQTVPGANTAGISYLEGHRKVTARAQSDPLITEVDDLQTVVQQGPCIEVLSVGCEQVRVDDLSSDTRWPAFCPAAVERGVRSVPSLRLSVEDVTVGVLSLFSDEPDAFDASSEIAGELFATHASMALGGIRREQQLNLAVRRRDVIGQAKGVLMAQHGLDEETAFATLVQYSQQTHVKLYDVAVKLLDSLKADRQPE
jgi:transcriptional regulator with GAF, ATPase, and Fis domain